MTSAENSGDQRSLAHTVTSNPLPSHTQGPASAGRAGISLCFAVCDVIHGLVMGVCIEYQPYNLQRRGQIRVVGIKNLTVSKPNFCKINIFLLI